MTPAEQEDLAGSRVRPKRRDETIGLSLFEQRPIEDPPPRPPTGPAVVIPVAEANRFTSYLAWRRTVDGSKVYACIEDHALTEMACGHKRISVNALAERARGALGLEVNNTYRAWIADDLVATHPELLAVIERRKRHSPR